MKSEKIYKIITKFIKEIDPNITVVWGGKLVHLAVNNILNELNVDYAVMGDGEYPFLHLLEALKNGSKIDAIPGIAFKSNSSITVNPNSSIVDSLDEIYQSRDFGWDLIKDKITLIVNSSFLLQLTPELLAL